MIKAISAYQPTKERPDRQDLVLLQQQSVQAINELLKRVAVLELEAAQQIIKIASLTSEQLTNPLNFVQSGPTQGLGLGSFAGLAICNGYNGTPAIDGKFLRWSITGSGSPGGSDSVTLTSSNLPTHKHPVLGGLNSAYNVGPSAGSGSDDPQSYAFVDDTKAIAGGSPAGYFEAKAQTGTTGQSFDNRPSHYHFVPLMRVQ